MTNFSHRLYARAIKIATALALCLALSLSSGASVFALNRDDKPLRKPFNFTGYRYVDDTHLDIFVDKCLYVGSDINAGMFTVKQHGTTNLLPVTGISYVYDGSGCSDLGLDIGTRITLTLGSSLTADTAYNVAISPFLFADKTLGNFQNTGGNPLDNPNTYFTKFTFRTPLADGTYSNTPPFVSFIVGGKPMSTTNDNRVGVSYESNLTVVFDRPFLNDATTLSTFLTNLSNNYKRAGTNVVVVQGTGNCATAEMQMAECHFPTSNNANSVNNTFYFPEQNYGGYWRNNTYVKQYSFNRENPGTNPYTLILPAFTDVSGHTFSNFINANSGQTLTTSSQFIFATVSTDLPGYATVLSSVTAPSTGGLTVSWDPGKIDPAPSGVQVWVCPGSQGVYGTYYTDPMWKTMNATTGTITIHGTTAHPLNVGTAYYVRIVPYSGSGLAGFSLPWRNETTLAPIAVAPVAP